MIDVPLNGICYFLQRQMICYTTTCVRMGVSHQLYSTGDFHVAGTYSRLCKCQIQPSPADEAHKAKPPNGV